MVGTGVETIEILIVGSPATGKTSFVQTICEGNCHHDAEGWQLGNLPVDDSLLVKFVEPPSIDEFDFLWLRDLIDQADVPGFIVMCDSTKPESFGEAIGLLESIRAFHPDTPCVLAANKQDIPGAWGTEDIRVGLGIPDHILVTPCIAHNRQIAKEVVLQLLYQIMG